MKHDPMCAAVSNNSAPNAGRASGVEGVNHDEPRPVGELFALVYEELRKLAAQKMAGEAPCQTLQPTALVHEAWLRLGADAQPAWENQAHFFAAAAEAMRRILVEKARRKRRLKHGGGQQRVDLDTLDVAITSDDDHLLGVDEALDKLAGQDAVAADLIKLRLPGCWVCLSGPPSAPGLMPAPGFTKN